MKRAHIRKTGLWLLLAIGVISTMVLLSCSQQSPLQPASSAATPDGYPLNDDGAVIPGEYIVVLKSTPSNGIGKITATSIRDVAASAEVTPQSVYTTVISGFSGKLTEAQYQALQNNPAVDHIEPNRTIHILVQNVSWGIPHVAAPPAHARGVRGGVVKVGIIDTGIDYVHPDLAANYVGGIDFVNGDNDPMDDHGHGTHVSGIVAAVDNTIGVLGVAPTVRLYGVKVLNAAGSGTYAGIIAGIDWCAANGMQVINMSLGGSIGSLALQTACDNANAAGVVICAAAGNSYGAVGYPAAYASCIAVSAIDQFNNLAVFSSRGPEVDVTAPGVGVISTYRLNGYASLSGTSMACPHVAGVCALILSTGNYPTAAAVRSRLESTCTDLGTPGIDDFFGNGLINADAATAGGGGGPINQPPVANANGPYSGSAGFAVSFSSAGSSDPDGTIASYTWNFGDGTAASTLANPIHIYSVPGTYTVYLTVTDNQGTTGTSNTTAGISGNLAPVANANGPYFGGNGLVISFSSAGSSDPDGTIASYAWDFGDGTTSALANPTHIYTLLNDLPRIYSVSLTVTDNLGLTHTSLTYAHIIRSNPPEAKANGSYAGTVGNAIQFSSTGSRGADYALVGYLWNFGDGATSASSAPRHAYAAPGQYIVSLTVTDTLGLTATDITGAEIIGGGGNPIPIVNGPYSGTSGIALPFSSAGSTAPNGQIVSYLWNFGDATTSTLANPAHIYARAGIYNISLTVTDNQGATGTANTSATIVNGPNMPPVANPNGPYSGVVGTAVSFSSLGSTDPNGVIVSYSWNFGDGTAASALANPTHIYAVAGTYSVTLTVTDNQGATGIANTTANIANGGGGNLPPVANANGPYSGTAGTAVSFSSIGSTDPDGTIASYSWNFGDGTAASTLANPTHIYAVAGTYTVSLTVTDNLGATGTGNATASITGGGGGADVVTITKAEYKVSQMQLIIRAKSSQQPAPTLTVVGYGTMTWKPTKGLYELNKIISPAPSSVTVISSLGGTATKAVLLQ